MPSTTSPPSSAKSRKPSSRIWRVLAWIVGSIAALIACGVFAAMIAFALAYRNLPSIDALTDYRPKIPLRVYTSDGVLIGEFGEERRAIVAIADVLRRM